MRVARLFLVLAFTGSPSWADPRPATGRITGVVVDTLTSAPLFEAMAVVTGPGLPATATAKSDMNGVYAIDVPAGSYGVVVAFGNARVEHASIVVAAGATVTLSDRLDVTGSIEVTTVHEKVVAPPAVAPVATRRSENRVMPYSNDAILTNDWSVAWLLLDVDTAGRVESFRFLNRPGHGLEDIAKTQAFRLSFTPARDGAGHAVPTRVLWKLEWPPYWRKDLVVEGTYLTGMKGAPPCRGSGPLRFDSAHPVYRDCSRPDYAAARTADLIRPDSVTPAVVGAAPPAPPDEIVAIGAACEARDGDACMELSLRETVPQRARALEEQACEAGNGGACVDIGARLVDGREPLDRDRAGTLFERACRAGDERGCELAEAKTPATLEAALNDIVCAQGDPHACYNRALGLATSDPARAERLYQRACLANVAIACSNLGLLLEKRESRNALELFQRACDDGEPIACTNLGHVLMDGVGAKKDLPRARAALEKACAAGDDVGCKNLAILLEAGLGGPRDARRANALRGGKP
jgi:hypothetical protein